MTDKGYTLYVTLARFRKAPYEGWFYTLIRCAWDDGRDTVWTSNITNKVFCYHDEAVIEAKEVAAEEGLEFRDIKVTP